MEDEADLKRPAIDDALTGHPGIAEALLRLGRLFDSAPLPENPFSDVRTLTGNEREFWQSLQLTLCPGSCADVDVACLLAYFGLDYRRNVRRVLRGCTLHRGQRVAARGARLPEEPRAVLLRVPGHIARLYHRWRDSYLLIWILACWSCSPDRRQTEHEALLSLWDDHWIEILLEAGCAGGARVADTLSYARPLVPEPLIWESYLHHLYAAVDSGDARLRNTAMEILSQLKMRGDMP